MSARVSLKLVCVLAAAAFVVAFRVHADHDDGPRGATTTATTLSASSSKALRSDVAQATPTAVAVRLAGAPGLPRLHRAPRPPARHVTATQMVVPAATAVATPAPTVAPVATAAPRVVAPVRTAAPPKYVGQAFDSKG